VPDAVIVVAAGAALRIASENLSDDPLSLYGKGHIKLSHLFILCSQLTLDHTAGQLPVGSTLTTKLLEMYGQFCSIVRDGARVKFTLQSISVDLNEFEQFIVFFLEVLLTALCFDATALPKLVDEAKNLAFISSKTGGCDPTERGRLC